MTVAALFVDARGSYAGLPGVDLWDEARDARLYAGPWPVVAHPPCARWSRLAASVEGRWGHRRGDDGGCFAAALAAVRRFGGVLEHPAYSSAWATFGLPTPKSSHGWTLNLQGEASCYVEQGSYGLLIAKPTWLYAHGVELVDLRWDQAWFRRYTPFRSSPLPKPLPNGTTSSTPPEFRDVLLGMARSASRVAA